MGAIQSQCPRKLDSEAQGMIASTLMAGRNRGRNKVPLHPFWSPLVTGEAHLPIVDWGLASEGWLAPVKTAGAQCGHTMDFAHASQFTARTCEDTRKASNHSWNTAIGVRNSSVFQSSSLYCQSVHARLVFQANESILSAVQDRLRPARARRGVLPGR